MEGAGVNITVVSDVDSVDLGVIACERSLPHVGDVRGFGAAVADLFKIALNETSKTLSVRGAGAIPHAASASVAGN